MRLEKQMARDPAPTPSDSSRTSTGIPPEAKIKRKGQSDRTSPDNDDLVPARMGSVLIRRPAVRVESERDFVARSSHNRVLRSIVPGRANSEGFNLAGLPTFRDPATLSRFAACRFRALSSNARDTLNGRQCS